MGDVFLWACPTCKVVIADDKPVRCPVCGTTNIRDGQDYWWKVAVL